LLDGQAHLAPEHTCPERQATSQSPQFFELAWTSMHVPAEAQYFWPASGHEQALSEQVSPGLQACPQTPQLALSLERFTQAAAASHHVCPYGQPHLPLLQISVARQACPQVPQLSSSNDRLWHSAPHVEYPYARHWHWPPEHRCVELHVLPQVPQLFESLTGTQAPSQ
jgi:hypothetical protein